MTTYRNKIKEKLVGNIQGTNKAPSKIVAPPYVGAINNYVVQILSSPVFNNNTSGTRALFNTYLATYLIRIMGAGYIDDFKIICDDTNNVDYSDEYNIVIHFHDISLTKWLTVSYKIAI